ncbi:MAG: 2-phosphosulfolactate phosphatase [Deltaproteobacteria bacterium]
MKVHVLVQKRDLDGQRLRGKVVVVLDVLFATTSIAAALAHGATEVVPAPDGDAALAEAARRPAGSYLLAGEYGAVTLPGFAHPTPMELLRLPLAGKALLYATTNGTVALHRSTGADRVYAAALANGAAVAERVAAIGQGKTVLLVCSGSSDRMNLEDFYGAGHLVSHLARLRPDWELSDAALAARLLHEKTDALACLSAGRLGRMMREYGLEREVEWAARKDHLSVVPELVGGRLVSA